KRACGQLLDALIGLRHVRRVLRIRAAQTVVDVPHRIADHEQRANRIEYADVPWGVARRGKNLEARDPWAVVNRRNGPWGLDLWNVCGTRIYARLRCRRQDLAHAAH